MKAIYQKPETNVTKLVMEHVMLDTSNPNVTIDRESEVEAANVDSRRTFSLWGDDEE